MCAHEGMHSIESAYDHAAGVLRWLAFCDGCGDQVREVAAVEYRPAPAFPETIRGA